MWMRTGAPNHGWAGEGPHMASAAAAATSQARRMFGAVKDVREETGTAPLLLCGRKEPLDELMLALGGGSPATQLFAVRRLVRDDATRLSEAAVVVYGGEVVSGLDAQTRSDLEVIGRATAPKLAMLEALDLPSAAVAEAGRVRGVMPSDLMPYRRGRFPAKRAMERLAEKAGPNGPYLAAQLPAFRPHVVDRLIEKSARTNAKTALIIFVPGADMPILTALQMRMVLGIGACYGEQVSTDRAVELLSVLGAGFGFRAVARELLDLVPVAGRAVKSAIAYSAPTALGRAADEYFAHGAVADVSHLRALAEGVRAVVLEMIKKRRG
jgi:uncharacterized protein (DUF697 family)